MTNGTNYEVASSASPETNAALNEDILEMGTSTHFHEGSEHEV